MKSNLPWYGCVLTLTFSLFASSTSLPAQVLTVTDGLQLWLRADAGVTLDPNNGVLEWADQSGNANNASQGVDTQAPKQIPSALNSLPVLRFDGEDDYLDVADSDSLSGTGDMSSFFVVKFEDFATYRAVWGKTAANFPAPTDIYALPGSGVLRIFRGDGTQNNLSSADTVEGLRANTYLVLGFTVAADRLTHYLNNQENGSGASTLITGDADTSLKIGTRSDFVTKLKGDLAELLIYNKALDATERASVFTYLQTKYNLLNLLPSCSLAAVPAGPNVNVGDIIRLNATASDPDGTITRVDFFANGTLLGTALTPPFSLRVRLESAGTVQFTARATDNLSGVANSAPVTFTSGPTGPTTLPVTENLQLWLRADEGTSLGNGDTVVEWADQSGNANNAAQLDEGLAPVLVNSALNGKPVLLFDGVDDYLDVPDSDTLSNTGDITTLYVVRFSDFGTYRAVWGKTTANLPASTDIYALPGSGVVRLYRGNGTLAGIAAVDGARPYPAGAFMLGGFDQAGSQVSHYLNGVPNGGGTLNAPLADADGPLRIGSRADFVTRFKGEMAELLIYDRALSTIERHAVERHLLEKYGLPPSVSVTNTLPTIAITAPIGQVLTAPGTVTITTSAADADGAVASVQFFANGVLLATDTSAPFETPLTLRYGGKVTLSAVVTDNIGAQVSAVPVEVCVQGPGAPTGLIGYWPLDGNGTATVGANGNPVNGPVASEDRNGQAGGALAFDGLASQRVEVPNGAGLNGATAGSISMWVRWTGPQDAGFGNTYGSVLGRQGNGQFSNNILSLTAADPDSATLQWRQNNAGAATITGGTTVGNNTWHHIAVTFSDTASEVFLDGISEGTGVGGVLNNGGATPLTIGAWAGDGGSYATASIDDVAVWNRVLSADEVSELAQQTKTPLNLQLSPDCLSIVLTGTKATIRWGSGTILQEATDIFGPWDDVVGTSPLEVTVQGPLKFYRLRSN